MDLSPSNSAADLIKDGWFFEIEQLWPGQKFGLQVEKVLLNGKSQFQDILLFESTNYGKVLVLDGVIQVTERDEYSYQEMIVHLPMFANSMPKKVLIIGGGDGGVLREVAKHPSVEAIHMCEIDRQVVEVSKHFLSESLAASYNDPRLTLMYDDAAAYLREQGRGQNYDCIVIDSSDPVGPAETLFRREFFQSVADALAPGGVMCNQGECQWLHLPIIAQVMDTCRDLFSTVKYGYTTIPTYPSGQIGFVVCTKNNTSGEPVNPAEPSRDIPESMDLKYYNTDLHRAAFVLPRRGGIHRRKRHGAFMVIAKLMKRGVQDDQFCYRTNLQSVNAFSLNSV